MIYPIQEMLFLMENQGDGRLNVSIYNYIPEDGYPWYNETQGISIVENFDNDTSEELLYTMKYYGTGGSILPRRRKLGYLNVDKINKTIDFVSLLNSDEFLYNPNWTIDPRFFIPIEYQSYPNRKFILHFLHPQEVPPLTILKKNQILQTEFLNNILKFLKK